MEVYFFEPEKYAELYNCSQYSIEEWKSFSGEANRPLGLLYMSIGTVYISLYWVCLFIMAKKKFLEMSCYKIMFYLGILDVSTLHLNAIMMGYMTYSNMVFCENPALYYMGGSAALGLWCGTAMTCMLLGTNRLCDLANQNLTRMLFEGKRTLLWLMVPTLYMAWYVWYSHSIIFSTIYYGAFFDPFVGTPAANMNAHTSFSHAFNNVLVIVVLACIYSAICYILFTNPAFRSDKNAAVQRSIILQTAMICFFIFTAATIYVKMQFILNSVYEIIFAQLMWQCLHGAPVIIYLLFNKSIQKEFFRIFGIKPKVKTAPFGTNSIAKGQVSAATTSVHLI